MILDQPSASNEDDSYVYGARERSQSVDPARYSYDPALFNSSVGTAGTSNKHAHNDKNKTCDKAEMDDDDDDINITAQPDTSSPKDSKYYCPYRGICSKARGGTGDPFTSRSGILNHIEYHLNYQENSIKFGLKIKSDHCFT